VEVHRKLITRGAFIGIASTLQAFPVALLHATGKFGATVIV